MQIASALEPLRNTVVKSKYPQCTAVTGTAVISKVQIYGTPVLANFWRSWSIFIGCQNKCAQAQFVAFKILRYCDLYYCGDWVPKIRVPKGNTRTRIKFWVWVGLGLCLKSMGIFGLGTHKVQNFGFFWVLPLGTREDWVPKIWAPKGNTQTVLL